MLKHLRFDHPVGSPQGGERKSVRRSLFPYVFRNSRVCYGPRHFL